MNRTSNERDATEPGRHGAGAHTPAQDQSDHGHHHEHAHHHDHVHEQAATGTGAGEALKDPVCGMTVSADSRFQAEHAGARYYFCSASCQQK